MLISWLKIASFTLRPKPDSLSKHEKEYFRVKWGSLDLNGHVNNAWYLVYANRARLIFLAKKGVLSYCLKRGLSPVIIENRIRYRKSLKPLEKFSVETRFLGIRDKDILLEHEFFDQSQRSCAIVLTNARILGDRKIDLESLLKHFEQGPA